MRKNMKIRNLMVLALFVVFSFFILGMKKVEAATTLTSKYYSYTNPDTGEVMTSEDYPLYIQFKPGSKEYNNYGNTKFWRTTHNKVVHYSPIPPEQLIKKPSDRDLSKLIGNKQSHTFSAGRIDFFPDPFYDRFRLPNLKKGRTDPSKRGRGAYMGDGSGSTYIDGTLNGVRLKGYFEWRYLGYTSGGQALINPTFPGDYTSGMHPNDRLINGNQVYERPWDRVKIDGKPLAETQMQALVKTDYDNDPKKLEWIKDYFFGQPENKDWLLPRKGSETHLERIDRTAKYYVNRFTLKGNPEEGSTSMVMLHKTYNIVYIYAVSTTSPPERNLRITSFEVIDPKSGDVLGLFKRNAEDNDNVNEFIRYREDKEPFLRPGETYRIRAVVKNMKINDLVGKDTEYQPLGLNFRVAMDTDIKTEGKYSLNLKAGSKGSGSPRGGLVSIPYGKDVYFNETTDGTDWTFTVPNDGSVKDEIKFRVDIPLGFYLNGENTYTKDDFAELILPLEKDDIGVSSTAELVDKNGGYVDEIEQGEPYTLRFTIDKPFGHTPVGDPSNPTKNPFASLSVKVTDGINTYTYSPKTDKIMKFKDKVVVEIPNAIAPEGTFVEAEWQISQIHRDLMQSTYFENDGPFKQTWRSDINISVSNFHVSPAVVHRTLEEPAGSEQFTVRADIMNSNPTGKTKDIDVIVRQGGRTWKFVETVPANQVKHFAEDLGEIDLSYGSTPFEIEVNYPNPSKRKWVESKMDGSNPYIDNIAYKSVLVRQNQLADKCEAVHTRNNWETTYTLTHYDYKWISQGYYRYYTDPNADPEDPDPAELREWVDTSYCKTEDVRSWEETRSHYESYNIEKVLFKSKHTEDNKSKIAGADNQGWVDILANPAEAKVKAGYGFELKYSVRYSTNVTNVPQHWGKTGCDGTERTIKGETEGKSISIPAIPVYPPTVLNVEMPYSDESGRKVQYRLHGNATGHWTNQVIDFQMPLRQAVSGQGSDRKIYVNESARDDTHVIRIDTQEFAGTHEKVHPGINLCDTRYIGIHILGASSDDVNTHITQ